MISVDLNCDMGEGFALDAELMQYVSSANIACGFHAGDFSTMAETASLAIKNNVAIGAHPGFPDKENFGRHSMKFSTQEVYDMVLYQIGALQAIAKSKGASLHHVKPHGALYNVAAIDKEASKAIVSAIKDFNDKLILYGLANSELIKAAKEIGLGFRQEVFADRTYQRDGTLTSRTESDALIEDDQACLSQVLRMAKERSVLSLDGSVIPIQADTICIHGDGLHAVRFAKLIHDTLMQDGIHVSSK